MFRAVHVARAVWKFALISKGPGGRCLSMFRVEDNRLETFCRICDRVAQERSYINKAQILQQFFTEGSAQDGFKGDTVLWVQMLVPAASHRVYNLQNRQLLKLFGRLFGSELQRMQLDLEQEGDVSETVRKFFESSRNLKPQPTSTLYLQDVEELLIKLEQRTKEDEQTVLLRDLCKQATALDLKMIVRIIKQDLRMNAKARHVLDAFGPLAYPAYQSSRDLASVVRQFAPKGSPNVKKGTTVRQKAQGKTCSTVGQVQVMTPISPMLASACKSVDEAFTKSPAGLYSEVKYDGERVQIHKRGNEFKFFSRNLKPVMDHKIKRFKEFIPKAFPEAGDMILDSEIILVDTVTGELLPFGTLGAQKKKEYAQAEVCIFVFDCILFNGKDLTSLPFRERRDILMSNITPIKSYVELSESHFLQTKSELAQMTAKVLKANLEGVVLKSPSGTYQPGKRGWLKVKKDYLFGGKMADTADLVVLGAWYGSGKKGGVLSIFLMGCYDRRDGLWKTVTKVHSGLDDETNEEIHNRLMELMDRANANKLPTWLLCKKALVPDYLAKDPQKMPVWEITGAEFTKSEAHTAGGISIRFPRITRLRDDKSAESANDLEYLENLFVASKSDVNVDLLLRDCPDEGDMVSMDTKKSANLTPQKVVRRDNEMPSSSRAVKKPLESENGSFLETETKAEKTLLETNSSKRSKGQSGAERPAPKQRKLDFGAHISPANNPELFEGLIAFFPENTNASESKQLFEANGGVVAKSASLANVAFYESVTADVDLEQCRHVFKNTCRHLSKQWLHDSLKDNELKAYPLYAVLLKHVSNGK